MFSVIEPQYPKADNGRPQRLTVHWPAELRWCRIVAFWTSL